MGIARTDLCQRFSKGDSILIVSDELYLLSSILRKTLFHILLIVVPELPLLRVYAWIAHLSTRLCNPECCDVASWHCQSIE